MAIMKVGPIAIISGLALAGIGAAATLMSRDGKQTVAPAPAAVESPAPAQIAQANESADAEIPDAGGEVAQASTSAPAGIDFMIGSVDDLRRDQLSAPFEKIESVAAETKVWVATADVASAPGVETFYHLKGPLTCGRIGCDLIVVSGGSNGLHAVEDVFKLMASEISVFEGLTLSRIGDLGVQVMETYETVPILEREKERKAKGMIVG